MKAIAGMAMLGLGLGLIILGIAMPLDVIFYNGEHAMKLGMTSIISFTVFVICGIICLVEDQIN